MNKKENLTTPLKYLLSSFLPLEIHQVIEEKQMTPGCEANNNPELKYLSILNLEPPQTGPYFIWESIPHYLFQFFIHLFVAIISNLRKCQILKKKNQSRLGNVFVTEQL